MNNYSFNVVWSPEDGEYVATSVEFPGLSGLAASPEDAVSELRKAIEIAIQAFTEDGEPVPVAETLNSYSGQLRLRLPRSVHAAAVARADREGVSLNSLLQSFVCYGLGMSAQDTEIRPDIEKIKHLLEALSSDFLSWNRRVTEPVVEGVPEQKRIYFVAHYLTEKPEQPGPFKVAPLKRQKYLSVAKEPTAPFFSEAALQ